MWASLLILTAALSGGEPSDDAYQWLETQQQALLDAFMPVSAGSGAIVACRNHGDGPPEPEDYLAIRESDGFEASIVAPAGASLRRQLLALHEAEPRADIKTLLDRVRVTRSNLSHSTCPAISRQIERLGRLRFRLPERQILILHPDVHRVLVDWGGGTVDATLYGDHPLVQWCAETLRELQACPAR